MLQFRVALESAELEQPQWPKNIKSWRRRRRPKVFTRWVLLRRTLHLRLYDGEPEYRKLREEVEQVLTGKKPALSHDTSDKLR